MSIPNRDAPLGIVETGKIKDCSGGIKEIQFGFAVLIPQLHLCSMWVQGETEPCIFSQFNPNFSILALNHWKEASVVCSGFRAENLQVAHSTLTESQRSFAQT